MVSDNVDALLYLSGLGRDQSRRDVSLYKTTIGTGKITAKGSKYHWDILHKLFSYCIQIQINFHLDAVQSETLISRRHGTDNPALRPIAAKKVHRKCFWGKNITASAVTTNTND